MQKFIILLLFFNLLHLQVFSQQFIIVGPQNACAQGVNKNIHTESKYLNIDGYAKLKITTQQHRTFDNSKIFDATSGDLLWEWKGESSQGTWYTREHYIEVNSNRIRVDFTQGYRDPFCNGFIKVENTRIIDSSTKSIYGNAEQAKNQNNNAINAINNQERQVSFQEQIPTNSYLDGSVIHPTAKEYYGQITGNKANGWGTILWNNGTKTEGYFENNILLSGSIKTTFPSHREGLCGAIVIGPNGYPNFRHSNNGPCVLIQPDGSVENQGYIDGKLSGSIHELWRLNYASLSPNKLSLQTPSTEGHILDLDHVVKIPNSNKLILIACKKVEYPVEPNYWFEIFDIERNNVVGRIGSHNSPISKSWKPRFEFIDLNNFIYFSFSEKSLKKYISVNPSNGTYTFTNEATVQSKRIEKIKNQVQEIAIRNENVRSSSDFEFSERKLMYPTGNTIRYKNSAEGVMIEWTVNGKLKCQHFVKDRVAHDIALSEKGNYIAVSFGTISDVFRCSLAYIDSSDVREFERRLGGGKNGKLVFTEKNNYLIWKTPYGSRFYLGEELFFAVPGMLLFLDENESVACSNDGDISFFDLNNRVLISSYRKTVEPLKVFHHEVKHDAGYLLLKSGNSPSTVLRVDFKVPPPLAGIPTYQRKTLDEQRQYNVTEKIKDDIAVNATVKDEKSIDLETIESAYSRMLEMYLKYSMLTGKTPFKNNCKWCNRQFDWRGENGGYVYRKRSPYYQCEVMGSTTGDYCSKDCALKGCLANDR
jgi:hypothetical protein